MIDDRPYKIIDGLEDLLVESFLELESLVNSGKKTNDFYQDDEYDSETGALMDKEETPISFTFFNEFYRLVNNINFLLETSENKDLHDLFDNLKKNERTNMFIDKISRRLIHKDPTDII